MSAASLFTSATLTALLFAAVACASSEQALRVKASAYNSLPEQTSGDPNIGAWGDTLRPGMRAIAVSRDLLDLGLTRGVSVSIDGLPGRYLVLDKMAARWKKKIDIYMGEDVSAARQWGIREVTIRWEMEKE